MSRIFKSHWKEINKAPAVPSIAQEELDFMIGDLERRMSNTRNFNSWWALDQQKQHLLLERNFILS